MQKIKFLGASGEVTGSSFLLTSENDNKLLIDFGMFQGGHDNVNLNYDPLGFKPSDPTLKGVLVTHAHLDHCGRLPLLVFGGYFGKIYMSAPTFALVQIILNDSAHIAMENKEREPLYYEEEVQKVLDMVEIVEYDKELILDNFSVIFRDAGHILGSSSIEITDNSAPNKTRFVFSGDLGNSPEDIVRPTRKIESTDVVVMETTYGDRFHPKDNPKDILQEEINSIEKSGGVLLIPAFSIERTQELLHRLNHLKSEGKIKLDTPIFLDSPMAIHATQIFREFKQFYNQELLSHTDDPFSFEGLVVTQDSRDSRDIIKAMEPKVIIAGSGMMSGGRIMHHLLNYLSRPTTRILFVGYQAKDTLGRKIQEGAKNVWIENKQVKIKVTTRNIMSLSSHADQKTLLEWLGYIKEVKKVFLVHGDEEARIAFMGKAKELGLDDITLPKNGEEFEINI